MHRVNWWLPRAIFVGLKRILIYFGQKRWNDWPFTDSFCSCLPWNMMNRINWQTGNYHIILTDLSLRNVEQISFPFRPSLSKGHTFIELQYNYSFSRPNQVCSALCLSYSTDISSFNLHCSRIFIESKWQETDLSFYYSIRFQSLWSVHVNQSTCIWLKDLYNQPIAWVINAKRWKMIRKWAK